jgi:hypothetical protein
MVNILLRNPRTSGPEEGLLLELMETEDLELSEIGAATGPILKTSEEPSDYMPLEVHDRHHPHDHAHVDLSKDEYVPEEVARMLGTGLEVIMHAIWSGDLKAERKGPNVVCIPRAALIEWYGKDRANK